MHRFYIPPEESRGATLTLTGPEAHHALRVLRVQEGEAVSVLDGAGGVIEAAVSGCARQRVELRVIRRDQAPAPAGAVTLLQALPKGKLFEAILQKATELGVARLVPLLSERVVSHLDGERAESKAEKWRQVAVEAMKQSGNPWLPRVEAPVSVQEWLARKEGFDLALVGSLEAGSRHPRRWFDEYRRTGGGRPRSVGLWVGPEGDFTPAEYAALREAGARPITLGRLVLRVETAAVCGLAVVNHELTADEAG